DEAVRIEGVLDRALSAVDNDVARLVAGHGPRVAPSTDDAAFERERDHGGVLAVGQDAAAPFGVGAQLGVDLLHLAVEVADRVEEMEARVDDAGTAAHRAVAPPRLGGR